MQYKTVKVNIQDKRIKRLNRRIVQPGRYVLYWMQGSQREHYNHALEYAVQQANDLSLPLLVFFGITDSYPNANLRHYTFMLEGLKVTQKALAERGIRMIIRCQEPVRGVVELAKDASLVVTDRGYLAHQKKWRVEVARQIDCPLVQVESDVIVPIEQASSKEEYSAATLRTKITKLIDDYLVPVRRIALRQKSLSMDFESVDISNIDKVLSNLNIDRTVGPVKYFRGGTEQGQKLFRKFLRHKLDYYPEHKNNPTIDGLSHMSPYLHFGQISALYLALKVHDTGSKGRDAYLEELIVRRELAINFVHYNHKYLSFASLPGWAQATLRFHQKDKREYVYSLEELEGSETHDPYWNAAQMEMVLTGKMHGYMRMYWGKKILEWNKSPRRAWQVAQYLNDKYELDGRDPNGYAGIAWCFGKHDRPWPERAIFGKVRYMNDSGLLRKFDAEAYVNKIRSIKDDVSLT